MQQCYNMPQLHNWGLNPASLRSIEELYQLLNNSLEIKIISDLSNFK